MLAGERAIPLGWEDPELRGVPGLLEKAGQCDCQPKNHCIRFHTPQPCQQPGQPVDGEASSASGEATMEGTATPELG